MGLRLAGIDIKIPDPTKPLDDQYRVLEVNSQPVIDSFARSQQDPGVKFERYYKLQLIALLRDSRKSRIGVRSKKPSRLTVTAVNVVSEVGIRPLQDLARLNVVSKPMVVPQRVRDGA
jgi:hypothetical protein